MAICDELRAIHWPSEFVVEYADGTKERLLRGDGVIVIPPADDPEGCGGVCADLPKGRSHQKQVGRYVRFTELRAVSSLDGHRLWLND